MMETRKQMEHEPAAAPDTFFSGEPGAGPAWLQLRREEARGRLNEIGFPTVRQEEWRFTNMAPLLQWPWRAAPADGGQIGPAEVIPYRLAGNGPCLVFVDGSFRPDLSTPAAPGAAVRARTLRAQWEADPREVERHLGRHASIDTHYFTALNTVFFQDGAFICAPAGANVEEPVQLLYLAVWGRPGAAVQARNLIVVNGGASLKVIETYASLTEAAHLTNAVTEISLGSGARLEHCRLQDENERAYHVAAVQAVQGPGSRWLSHSITTGGRLARNQIQTLLNAEGAEAILNGLYLGRGEQLMDHHTVVDHARPRCESHEFYHGILAGRSHGVFNGKIFVRPHAQKTNAKQTNRNLVLSENAVIDTKPQLEIFADDVKCTHGATVGQLNEEALFYLRSRGLGGAQARRMLIRAFADDVVGRVTMAPVRDHLERLLTARFEGLET